MKLSMLQHMRRYRHRTNAALAMASGAGLLVAVDFLFRVV
jgi:hypothetical protein